MSHYVVVLEGGRARIAVVQANENSDAATEKCVRLECYPSMEEAQQRCDIENDPVKRELYLFGDLKVQRPKSV